MMIEKPYIYIYLCSVLIEDESDDDAGVPLRGLFLIDPQGIQFMYQRLLFLIYIYKYIYKCVESMICLYWHTASNLPFVRRIYRWIYDENMRVLSFFLTHVCNEQELWTNMSFCADLYIYIYNTCVCVYLYVIGQKNDDGFGENEEDLLFYDGSYFIMWWLSLYHKKPTIESSDARNRYIDHISCLRYSRVRYRIYLSIYEYI